MTQLSKELLLITKFLNNPTDENLKVQIEQFRNFSPANELFYKQTERIWKLSNRVALLDKIDDKKKAEFLEKLSGKTVSKKLGFSFWLKGVAASILLVSIGYLIYTNSGREVTLLSKMTKANESFLVNLSDGSTVNLAENTELRYPAKFGENSREIYLSRGKAFFKIAKDASKPFMVVLDKSNVTVLGTSFNIVTGSEKIDLDVKTGKVVFSPYKGGTTLMLTAGQALSYDITKSQIISKKSQNAESWLTKELIFVDTPLEEVCEQLSKYYNQNIELQHTKKIVKKFNATFRDEELDEVLSILKETYNLKVEKSEHQVLLKINN